MDYIQLIFHTEKLATYILTQRKTYQLYSIFWHQLNLNPPLPTLSCTHKKDNTIYLIGNCMSYLQYKVARIPIYNITSRKLWNHQVKAQSMNQKVWNSILIISYTKSISSAKQKVKAEMSRSRTVLKTGIS